MMQETVPSSNYSHASSTGILSSIQSPTPPQSTTTSTGTILEGAFIDPAYQWPPSEGMGTNSLEVIDTQNTQSTEFDNNDEDLKYPSVPKVKAKRRVITETEITRVGRCGGFFKCCASEDAVIHTHTETVPTDPNEKERLKQEYLTQRSIVKQKRKDRRIKQMEDQKYTRVPDGVLVYRLDTVKEEITLISAPNSNTDMRSLMTKMKVVDAKASGNTNRKGILLTLDDGEVVEIVACEQRTATSWMEALNMMLGKDGGGVKKVSSCGILLFDESDVIIMNDIIIYHSKYYRQSTLSSTLSSTLHHQNISLTTIQLFGLVLWRQQKYQ